MVSKTSNNQSLKRKVSKTKMCAKKQSITLSRVRVPFDNEQLDILEGIPYHVLALDRNWTILYANRQQADLFGFAPSDMIGKNLWMLLPNIIGTDVERCFREAMANCGRSHFEIKGVYKPGYFELDASPITKGIAVYTRDITERKQAELALIQSEERFSKVFHSNPAALFLSRLADGYLIDVNESFLKIFGYKYDEVVGHTAFDLKIYRDPRTRDDFVRILETHRMLRDFELAMQSKTGQPLTLMASLDAIAVDGEELLLGILIDITERKKVEEALKQSDDSLNMAQRIANLGSWEFSIKEDKAIWSDEMFSIFNLEPQPFGPSIEEYRKFIHPEDVDLMTKTMQEFNESGRLGEVTSFDYRVVLADSSIKVLHTQRMIAEVDKSGKPSKIVGIEQDITDRKRIELLLEQYSNHLEQLVEERTRQLKDSERLAAIGATAGMVGHDIRNPLQAITNELYLTRNALANAPDVPSKPDALDSVQFIQEQVDYINKIVSDLQDYARPIKPVMTEVDVKALVAGALSSLTVPGNIETVIRYDATLSKIKTDPALLKRVLTNLASNAIQAMPNPGKLTIQAKEEKTTNSFVLSVEDTGVGIPVEVQEKIFTPLFTTKSKGQGFGLAVVKRVTEALGGTISFESQVGKGTTFTVTLPTK
jgi:PAS domain S-box-containing protein